MPPVTTPSKPPTVVADSPGGDDANTKTVVDSRCASRSPLDRGWMWTELDPNIEFDGSTLDTHPWHPARVPNTVAQELRHRGRETTNLDNRRFLYRCSFAGDSTITHLDFDGLATEVDIWLNGRLLGHTNNMFRRWSFAVEGQLGEHNDLVLDFHALERSAVPNVSRARWLTRLVASRKLRVQRTTFFGRMSGWNDPVAPVGPWRGVWQRKAEPHSLLVRTRRVTADFDGQHGLLDVCIELAGPNAHVHVQSARARIDEHRSIALGIESRPDGTTILHGAASIPHVSPWWPHTHGTATRHRLTVEADIADSTVVVLAESIGFRRVELVGPPAEGFALRINGTRVFCRGANWTPLGGAALRGDTDDYRAALRDVAAAGMNMVRVSGTTVYEDDRFYTACDELGILVWQDFMFANFDYPTDNVEFTANVETEVDDQLDRLALHPCIALWCGNSEVQQQATMMGRPPQEAKSAWFEQQLAARCRAARPDVPYWPSTPSGPSHLPFRVDSGTAHYFGVGAYRLPLGDERSAKVSFASECLAFANLLDDHRMLELLGNTDEVQRGVPCDRGADWDFLDITDHYLRELFDRDPAVLRRDAPERYRQLARVVPGELMARVAGYWRSVDSECNGALVWLLRDAQPGAGWGVVDVQGVPKAAYYYLRRVWSPRAAWFVDRGLNGLALCIANDGPQAWSTTLRVSVERADGTVVEQAEHACTIDPHGQRSFDVEALLDRFVDVTYRYQFGALEHAVVCARFVGDDGPALLATYLPREVANELDPQLELTVNVHREPGDFAVIAVHSNRLARAVSVEVPGFVPHDNYVDLPGNTTQQFRVARLSQQPVTPLRGCVRALNSASPVSFELPTQARR